MILRQLLFFSTESVDVLLMQTNMHLNFLSITCGGQRRRERCAGALREPPPAGTTSCSITTTRSGSPSPSSSSSCSSCSS